MKCPACDNPIEQGKVVLCVACFNLLPDSERVPLRKHYLRVIQIAKGNKAIYMNGMGPKIARVVRLVREARARETASESDPVAIVRISAESIS